MTKLPPIGPYNRFSQNSNKKENNLNNQKENISEINKTKGTLDYNLDNYSQYETKNFIKFKNRETFLNTKNIQEKFKTEKNFSISKSGEKQKSSKKPFIKIKNDDIEHIYQENNIKEKESENDLCQNDIPKFRSSSFSDNTLKNTKISLYSNEKENEGKENQKKNYRDITISNAFQSCRRFAETNTSYSRKDTFFNNLINLNESKGHSIIEVDEKNSPIVKHYKDFMNTNPSSNKKENKNISKNQMKNINIRYMVDLANMKSKHPLTFSTKKYNDDPTIYGSFDLNLENNTKKTTQKNYRDPKITIKYLSQALKTKNLEEEENLKRHRIYSNIPKDLNKENSKIKKDQEKSKAKNSSSLITITNTRVNVSRNLKLEKDSSIASNDIDQNISGFINDLEISQNIIDPKLYIPFSEFSDQGSSRILRPFQLSKYKRVSNKKLVNTKKEETCYNGKSSPLRKLRERGESEKGKLFSLEKKQKSFNFK